MAKIDLDDLAEEIINRHLAGESNTAIGAIYGCSQTPIRRVLRSAGFSSQRSRFLPDSDYLRREYEEGQTLRGLAVKYNSSKPTVREILVAAGASIRPRSAEDPNNAKRTGGRIAASKGYFKVWIEEDHHFASMRDSKGYVLEHRLVLADSLGRSLREDETGHHINGNTGDNRIENLQLRHGNHGAGIALACQDCRSENIVPVELAKVRVYQCGPMAGCTITEMTGWRDMLKATYPEIEWLDPCRRSYRPQQWRQLVSDDIDDITKADFLLAYYWKAGTGSAMELCYAYYYAQKPSVVVVDDFKTVSPWVRFHASYLVETFEEAVKIIKTEWPNAGVEGVHHP